MLKISHGTMFLGLASVALACTPRSHAFAERVGFDPLEYPGDSSLTCDVKYAGSTTNVALEFTGTDSLPTLQRIITAVFDAGGRPRSLDLVVPEPGHKPPRAHWIRVQFHPDVIGSRTVVDSGGGSTIQNIVRAADAVAQPMSEGDLVRTRSFMSRLWARRCSDRQG